MHCPRCGTNATVGQQFCRSCGLNLEKVTELLSNESALEPSSSIDERSRLRERQRKFEQSGGIAGLVTFGLILLLMIFVVFSQMILKQRSLSHPGTLLDLTRDWRGGDGLVPDVFEVSDAEAGESASTSGR